MDIFHAVEKMKKILACTNFLWKFPYTEISRFTVQQEVLKCLMVGCRTNIAYQAGTCF